MEDSKKIFVIFICLLVSSSGFCRNSCRKAVNQARSDFQHGNYSFHSEEVVPADNTYFYVLYKYYKINWYFTDSSNYYKCYDGEMNKLLQKKYGKKFLDRAQVICDSLDNTPDWRKNARFTGGDKALK
ncbi:hypothetical protein [Microbacter margulisiae]|uniref:Uncharacterized protein n=1 Tax=Microbacter margulisiae TaxID=1350067 RepID=A0A7W5DPX5_9PORP|nr:hypothetical protein [Microbacter margulisiae]MBB3186817.1 hypothetical protein [Microbacter margulisiae]